MRLVFCITVNICCTDETSAQLDGHIISLEAWAVAGAAVTAVLVLLVVAVIQFIVICHLWRYKL